MEKAILDISSRLLEQHEEFTGGRCTAVCPRTETVFGLIRKIRTAVFPGYFPWDIGEGLEPASECDQLPALIEDIHQKLSTEVEAALLKQEGSIDAASEAMNISSRLIGQLSDLQKLLHKDAEAGFEGDPAASSIDEIILTYPGFFAVFVYRIAHLLYSEKVPFIPRIMSEYAHSATGIDIHPGAKIGEYFFIDHGTGVVIGETTVIGNHVKLYQGVTLGALSTKKGQGLAGKKRHPTIEDGVTIYSGASILGGETIIGKNSTIGGNVFITQSIPQDAKVDGV